MRTGCNVLQGQNTVQACAADMRSERSCCATMPFRRDQAYQGLAHLDCASQI